MDVSLDSQIDFVKASYKWMLNKYKTPTKTYKYYCKYQKCAGYRMLYPKNNINYKLNIYSDYCTKHTNKFDNNKINKIYTNRKYKNKKLHININEYNNLDEINLDEINLDEIN